MTKTYNQHKEIEKRRYLRNNLTNAEKLLWSRLRKRQILNQRFLRQYGIGIYVVDFYCPVLKLAIEVDGATHSSIEEIKYDIERQTVLEELRINFLRFRNEEIFSDIGKVIKVIQEKIHTLLNNIPPLLKGGTQGG